MKKDILTITDLNKTQAEDILALAAKLKSGELKPSFAGKTLALVFEKPSLRTRVTFEAGMKQLGGHAIYLTNTDIQLGERESVADAARNLERWVDVIAARTFAHKTVEELAQNARIPVINALSDYEHPCQALADYLTIKEHKGELDGVKVVYVGDANNVCNSLYLLAAVLGLHFVVSSPEGYQPEPAIVSGGGDQVSIMTSVESACEGVDLLVTDVWASMGQEQEQKKRSLGFAGYQITETLMNRANKDALFMHCLPAHRGEEVSAAVIDAADSVVWDEAENRLHAQKALLELLLKN